MHCFGVSIVDFEQLNASWATDQVQTLKKHHETTKTELKHLYP